MQVRVFILTLLLAGSALAQVGPPSNAVAFLEGLVQMSPQDQRPALVIDAESMMNPADVVAYGKLMRTNPVAAENARALSEYLRAVGQIGPNEEIIGVSDGRALKARVLR